MIFWWEPRWGLFAQEVRRKLVLFYLPTRPYKLRLPETVCLDCGRLACACLDLPRFWSEERAAPFWR